MKQLVLDWDKYASKAIEAAGEGIVLLKNEDRTLPLQIRLRSLFLGACRITTTRAELALVEWLMLSTLSQFSRR